MINETVGKKIKPKYVPPQKGDVKHSLADISLAKKLLGYKPIVLFKEGLQKAIEWYRDNLMTENR
jgi:nucleoside-diphosphate-sugar epimerase